MKTFIDMEIKVKLIESNSLLKRQGILTFDNGYGISIVNIKDIEDDTYYSYTNNDNEWEVAILKKSNEENFGTVHQDIDGQHYDICYDTPLTHDVLGNQTQEDVELIIKTIQELS